MRITFFQWATHPSGSPESGRILVEAWRKRGWATHVITGHQGPYEQTYRELGCDVTRIEQSHWLRRTSTPRWLQERIAGLRSLGRIRQAIRSHKSELVYINTVVGIEAALAAYSMRIPIIWHLRDMLEADGGDVHTPFLVPRHAPGWLIRHLASHVVSVSHASAKSMLGRAYARCHIIPNGLPDVFFSQHHANTRTSNPRDIRIIIPGTIRPMKGHLFALEGLSRMSTGRPLQILISGSTDNAYAQRVRATADQLSAKSHVTFLGTVDNMQELMESCHIALIPSRGDPLPRTVMESMAAACAIVASDSGGIPEMVTHREHGLLVPYGDPSRLAQSLDELANNSELRAHLGRNAQRKCAETFTARQYVDRIDQLLSALY